MDSTSAEPIESVHTAPAARSREWPRRAVHPVLLVLACLAFAGCGARWLWLFRRGGLLDIDESGYLSFAIVDYRGWESAGLGGWWEAVLSPSIQAPLMTGMTTPAFDVLGVSALVGLLVPLGLGTLTLLSTWWVGAAVGGRRIAWLALALCAASPVIITYSRSYSFAVASAATVALALAALARSRNYASTPWSAALGVCLGLVLLSRTLTLALVPGLVIAALISVIVGPSRLRRLGNVLLAGLLTVLVAGPWYWRNGRAVWDYLVSFGYGPRSAEYGSDESLLSWDSWLATASYAFTAYGLPLAVVLGLGLVALVVARTRDVVTHAGPRSTRLALMGQSLLMPSAVFAIWSVLILTTSGNKGSGFLAPVTPALAVLVATGILAMQRPVRIALVVSAVAVLLFNTAVHADVRTPLADRRYVAVPGAGYAPLTDGAGRIHDVIRGGQLPPSMENPPMSMRRQRLWMRSIRMVARELDELGGTTTMSAFGFRHDFVNANAVQFEQLAAGRQGLILDQIAPIVTPDAASMTAWLQANGACRLLVAPGAIFEIEPVVDPQAIREAAKAAGFVSTDERWLLPGGRDITVWTNPACPPA